MQLPQILMQLPKSKRSWKAAGENFIRHEQKVHPFVNHIKSIYDKGKHVFPGKDRKFYQAHHKFGVVLSFHLKV